MLTSKHNLLWTLLFILFFTSSTQGKLPIPAKDKTILAANMAYFSYKKPHSTSNDGQKIYEVSDTKQKFKVVNEFVSNSGKYRALALMDDKNNLYYTYRGTKGKGDLRTDIIIGINRPLSYLSKKTGKELTIKNSLKKNVDRSINFYYETLKKLENNQVKPKSILVTGHSMGGVMAQMVGHKTGTETHTFNAPGAKTLGYYDTAGHTKNITNHVRSTDSIGNYGAHIGHVAYYNQSAKDGSFFKYPTNQHSITYFKNDLKRGMTPKIYKHGQK